MSDPLLKEIDFLRHARMLQAAAGAACPVAFCTASGEVYWTSESRGERHLSDAVGELLGQGADADVAERSELGEGRTLLCHPVTSSDSGEIGWLAVLAAEAGAEKLETALHEVSSSVGNEYRLHSEVASLVGELSDRYEELNLVYSLQDTESASGSEGVGVQSLMQNFAGFLNIDATAFLLGSSQKPIYAENPARPLPDIDLVLAELRTLWRFVSIGKKPIVINESDDPRRTYLLAKAPYRVIACPVANGPVVDGMLALVRHPDQSEFSNSDRNLAMVVAKQVAVLLRNRKMLGDMRRFADQMAAALIEAVEAKDPYTRGHSERVQGFSVRLGRAAELLAADVEAVSWGALLHDVGKIGIPDAILCKTGKLTNDEYTLVKIHPERSYEILRHVEHLGQNALDAARYHQEKFDGTGYPHGLRGDDIPLHARVIAVGDTYDAITSSRAYRAAQSHEAAMREIRDVAGSQLDPRFVAIFEKLFEDDPLPLLEIAGRPESSDA